METIVAIDLGKNKSVLCDFDLHSLKTQYRTVRTRPEVFHDIFAEKNRGGWSRFVLLGQAMDQAKTRLHDCLTKPTVDRK